MLLFKSATTSDAWTIFDAVRGITVGGNDEYLMPDNSGAGISQICLDPTSTGFKVTNTNAFLNESGADYIYMAIRRPNKPAEEFEPEELFAVDSMNSDGQFESGFPVGFALQRNSVSGSQDNWTMARLTQGKRTKTNDSAAESTEGNAVFDYQDRWYEGSGLNTDNMSWMWRRAPGFFDVVAYEGNDSESEVPHNLGVAPEMMWVKRRSGAQDWHVYSATLGHASTLYLNYDNDGSAVGVWNGLNPTDTVFTAKGFGVNASGSTYIAYLFASVPGICDIGVYEGTGSTIDIDCGFTNGARWVLIKRADGTGDWLMPAGTIDDGKIIALNNTEAAKTSNALAAIPSGFQVNTLDANLNAVASKYIYMAIA